LRVGVTCAICKNFTRFIPQTKTPEIFKITLKYSLTAG
jgi:hypothetical protein